VTQRWRLQILLDTDAGEKKRKSCVLIGRICSDVAKSRHTITSIGQSFLAKSVLSVVKPRDLHFDSEQRDGQDGNCLLDDESKLNCSALRQPPTVH